MSVGSLIRSRLLQFSPILRQDRRVLLVQNTSWHFQCTHLGCEVLPDVEGVLNVLVIRVLLMALVGYVAGVQRSGT